MFTAAKRVSGNKHGMEIHQAVALSFLKRLTEVGPFTILHVFSHSWRH